MSTLKATSGVRPNLIRESATASAAAAPFVGDQRKKALALLATYVTEQKAVSVMQIINRDPSLALENLDVPLHKGSNQTSSIEFPLACLRAGIAGGYVASVHQGFPIDKLLQGGSTNLLQTAISHKSGDRSTETDVGLLLGMGADPSAMPSPEAIYGAVATAFPASSEIIRPGIISMLIDAKASFVYGPDTLCPASAIAQSDRWNTPDGSHELTMCLVKLIKIGGIDVNRKTGTPRLTPLQRALGSKCWPAVLGLIRVGAKSSAEHLGGKDLFAVLASIGLKSKIPEAQAALMESHISRGTVNVGAVDVPITGDLPAARVDPRRRRAGSI